jgi:hypothetical protein
VGVSIMRGWLRISRERVDIRRTTEKRKRAAVPANRVVPFRKGGMVSIVSASTVQPVQRRGQQRGC